MMYHHWMSLWRSTKEALLVAAIFAVPVFGGLWLGSVVDRGLNTQPVFTLGLLGLGVIGGFYGLISIFRRMNGRTRQ